MTRMRAELAVLLFLAAACGGESREERFMNELGARCNLLASEGRTLAQADQEFVAAGFFGPLSGGDCRGDLLPVPGADTCGPATATTRICQVYWYWRPSDPDACDRGCCACEGRVTEAALSATGDATPLCASRFVRPINCPF